MNSTVVLITDCAVPSAVCGRLSESSVLAPRHVFVMALMICCSLNFIPSIAAQDEASKPADDAMSELRKAFEQAYAPIEFPQNAAAEPTAVDDTESSPSSTQLARRPMTDQIDRQPAPFSPPAEPGATIDIVTPGAFQPLNAVIEPGSRVSGVSQNVHSENSRPSSRLVDSPLSTGPKLDPATAGTVNDRPVTIDAIFNSAWKAPPVRPPAMMISNQDSATDTAAENQDEIWWTPLVAQSIEGQPIEEVFPDMLVRMAIQSSPRILAISQQPLIQETQIGEARGDFDPELFIQSQFEDRTDPAGNTLTAGGLPFLKDHIWTSESGVRRKMYSGAQLEIGQKFGFQNSNSPFFDPQDQGTATLSIDFSQPLLRGRGRYFNRSQILIAQVSSGVAWDRFSAELQEELVSVVEAYWSLYYTRSVLLQKQRNVERGQLILNRLEGRSELDSLPSQIARARAAVQSRRIELANAMRDVKDSETEIRRLIASPLAFQREAPELLPIESPETAYMPVDLDQLISDAMQFRPEVAQALKRAKIAAVQRNVSKNELLPELNLIFNTYVSALEGDSDIATAWAGQFARSTPGYAVGLEFAVPYGRRAAKARYTRQQLIVNQIKSEVDEVLLQVVSESQVAWRRVESAHQTMAAARAAISASLLDLEQNQARWESFGLVEGDLAEGQTPTTLLDQLLDAQQRLTNSELTFSQALLEFKIAEIQLKKASGNLLKYQQISFSQARGPQGPEMIIQAGDGSDN